MPVRRHLRTKIAAFVAIAVVVVGVVPLTLVGSSAAVQIDQRAASTSLIASPRGAVVKSAPLSKSLWIPGTTRAAYKLLYVTSDTFGQKAYSSGTVFIPKGKAPVGGWPVISWAHGTSGLGDRCAPSVTGPAAPERDWAYLGTPGLHAYLDGKAAAHNIVDIVAAGRAFAAKKLPVSMHLSRKWVTVGQSQGGGASIYTARYATTYGGKSLSYRGAVGTGTPANIEKLLLLLGPKAPPLAVLPEGITSYVAYILASLRFARPNLDIDSVLTPLGRRWVNAATTTCVMDLERAIKGQNIGDWFTKPLASLPGFTSTVSEYMGMPEKGFDKPFFMANGLLDTDVPTPTTAAFVAVLLLNNQPVTFKTYLTDHSGTMQASIRDSIPFVARLLRG